MSNINTRILGKFSKTLQAQPLRGRFDIGPAIFFGGGDRVAESHKWAEVQKGVSLPIVDRSGERLCPFSRKCFIFRDAPQILREAQTSMISTI